jgi:RNA polymerase sigma-70 factor (ECF subfamily)
MKDRTAEKELVRKIIQKDEQAFFEFVRRYEKDVFLFINKQLRNKELSEEVTQDVFIDFLDALRDFQFQSSLKTFLFSIAKYKTIDVIRKKKVKKVLFSGLPDYVVERLGAVVMDDELEKKELVQKMDRVLNSLPFKYRLILQLKYVEGVRVKAIADRLSMNFKSTESLLFRARKAFIELFQTTQ